MIIRLQKISPTHHRLEVTRQNGSQESAELETKSFLGHDLLHYAVEAEAGLEQSFWGLAAQGHSFVALSAKDEMKGATVPRDELGITEMVVGALTGFLQQPAEGQAVLDGLKNGFAAYNLQFPSYLTLEYFENVAERYRKLLGHWRGTPFGETMELAWPATSPR